LNEVQSPIMKKADSKTAGREAASRRRPRMTLLERVRRPTFSSIITVSGFAILNSNASGVVNLALAFSPSSEGLNSVEWTSYVSNLWSLARIRVAQIQVMPYFDEIKSGYTGSPLGIGTNLASIVGPTTLGQVLDNGDSKLYNVMNDTTSVGFSKVIQFSNLEYGSITNLSAATGYGAPGCVQFYGSGYPANTNIALYRYTYIFQVRNRI